MSLPVALRASDSSSALTVGMEASVMLPGSATSCQEEGPGSIIAARVTIQGGGVARPSGRCQLIKPSCWACRS